MIKVLEYMMPLLLLSLSPLLTLVKSDKAWLSALPDSRQLNSLAFIGTHDTAGYGTIIPFARTQALTMTQQLEAGIRVFDMRVRRISDVFAMHHERVYLGMMFGDLLNDVEAYLTKRPKEFVIMMMQEEHTAENSKMSECQILEDHYINGRQNLFVKHWTVSDTVGQHRGKVLLATGNNQFDYCVTDLNCKEQNEYELSSFINKFRAVKALQSEVSVTTHAHPCYINYLSANWGVLGTPYWIAVTKRFLPAGPNVVYGMNDLMVSAFHNPKNTLYIIMADFPNRALIDKVVNSNN